MRRFVLLLAILQAVSLFAQDGGRRVSTTIQLPTFGVAVDALGELTVKSFPDPTGQLQAKRIAAARAKLSADITVFSELRKVSLKRLVESLTARLDAGDHIDESMQFLAGLQRVQYVFLYPDENDVVIAGPAEGWVADLSGRVIGITTRRPVVRLDDLAVASRVYAEKGRGRPFLGCTIDPPEEGLARLRQFQKSMPNVIPVHRRSEWARAAAAGTRTALGMADVRLFGIPSTTHFAQVLVEADYRMKCMAVGLEVPPVPMKSYAEAMGRPATNTLQRWWFTPNYECVRQSEDKLSMELVGQGVQLQTEDRVVADDGKITAATGTADPAAAAFANHFTERYAAIAAARPVFAELRNLIDLAIAAAWLHGATASGRVTWSAEILNDERRLIAHTLPTPQKVACVANAIWSGNRLLVPAGGGVSIHPDRALLPESQLPVDPAVAQRRKQVQTTRPPDRWWWD